jgi:hypothetical protein
VDPFESPFWDLTTAAAWAVTREADAVRLAADPTNEAALFESRGAYLARWREVNERLWGESGWQKPDDPPKAGIDLLSDTPAVRAQLSGPMMAAGEEGESSRPTNDVRQREAEDRTKRLSQLRAEVERLRQLKAEDPAKWLRESEAEDHIERLRQLETEDHAERLRQFDAEGKIRLWYVFPIIDYLKSLFQAGRLDAIVSPPRDAAARAVPPADWPFLEIVGGDHQRLFVRRIGEPGEAFGDVRVGREQILAVFPSFKAPPVSIPPRPAPEGHGKKAAAIAWLPRRFPSGRPMGRKNPELQRMFENEGGASMHRNTFGDAVRDAWQK